MRFSIVVLISLGFLVNSSLAFSWQQNLGRRSLQKANTKEAHFSSGRLKVVMLGSTAQGIQPLPFKQIVTTGFISTENSHVAEHFYLPLLHKCQSINTVHIISDSNILAKRILTSPKTVYSGLIDKIMFHEIDVTNSSHDLAVCLRDSDVWVGMNVSLSHLKTFTEIAVSSTIRRLVFSVYIPEELRGNPDKVTAMMNEATEICRIADIDYTLIKHGKLDTSHAQHQIPFRILQKCDSLFTADDLPGSSADLQNVLVNCINFAKTHNQIFGFIRGNKVDEELFCRMTSEGWTEEMKLHALFANIAARIEQMYIEQPN